MNGTTVQFENGPTIEFERPPTQEDIEEVAIQLNLKPSGFENSRTPEADYKSAQRYKTAFPLVTGQDNPATAGLKAFGNLPGSALNLSKNILTSLINTVNPNPNQNTLVNLAKVGAGGIEKLVGSKRPEIQNWDVFAQALRDRYGSVDNLARTATNDPFAFGSEVLALLEGGASLIGKQPELNEFLSNVAQKGVIQPAQAALNMAGRTASDILGTYTGVGQGNIKEAVLNPGEDFTNAMRGNVAPEQIVQNAQKLFEGVKETRRANYTSQLAKIGQQTESLDISPINDELSKQLDNFGIEINEDGSLDFSRSSIASKSEAVNDIQGIYDTLRNWGLKRGDRNPIRLDTLKRQLGDYYSPSGNARAFVTAMRSSVKDILDKQVPGYSDMTQGYENASDLLKEMKGDLGVGSKATADAILGKLTRAMKADNSIKQDILNQLAQSSDKGPNLMSHLAGYSMSQPLMQGTVGKALGGLLGYATYLHPTAWPMLFAGSPRIVGEFLNVLGIAKKGAEAGVNILNKLPGTLPTLTAAGATNFLSPLNKIEEK